MPERGVFAAFREAVVNSGETGMVTARADVDAALHGRVIVMRHGETPVAGLVGRAKRPAAFGLEAPLVGANGRCEQKPLDRIWAHSCARRSAAYRQPMQGGRYRRRWIAGRTASVMARGASDDGPTVSGLACEPVSHGPVVRQAEPHAQPHLHRLRKWEGVCTQISLGQAGCLSAPSASLRVAWEGRVEPCTWPPLTVPPARAGPSATSQTRRQTMTIRDTVGRCSERMTNLAGNFHSRAECAVSLPQ